MKDLLYISHPTINEISANILKRKYENNTTKLILDKSIFMPQNDFLLDEYQKIGENELIDIKFVNENLVHTIKGKTQKSSVNLYLNKKNRLKNLDYNTAFYIFKALFYKFYNIENINLEIKEDYSQIKVSNFYEDFKVNDFIRIFNKLIDLGLKVNKNKDFVSIGGFKEYKACGVYLDNTKYLEGIFIFSIEKIEKTLLINFITGNDYKNFTKNNIKIIDEIKKVSLEDYNSSDKIRKIISIIQQSVYL